MKSSLIILLYHGITKYKSKGIENISNKHIHVDSYFKQMRWLKDNSNLISMDEVVFNYKNSIPFKKNSVAITFDDGFENNYSVAMPIIRDLKIPTTFYISSGMISSDDMFWVDKLEDCINLTLKKEIPIKLNGNTEIYSISDNENKIISLKKIKKICKSSKNSERLDIVKQVIKETKINPSNEHSPNYKILEWDQLIEMNEDPNVIIGGHSLRHEILSSLKIEEMKKNIKDSLNLLKKNLKEDIIHYSYPEGQEEHFNINVIKYLKSEGIICSPSAKYGRNTKKEDLFNLNRVMVGFDNIPFPKEAILNNKNLEAI